MAVLLKQSAELSAARDIAATLRRAGHQALFAGGCVRDVLLGREPADWDVATSALPEQIIELFPRTESVGAHFGVVLVIRQAGGERVATEVATFRHDGVYLDGRRPEAVRFTLNPEEDVERRDFTINGMLLDPALCGEDGGLPDSAILDFVGGRDDLARGVLRAIGDPHLRFTEDKLRMLRGVRFAARLGFDIDPVTFSAILDLAPEIGAVSAERVRDELTRMLTEGHAARAFRLLDESGLLAQVLPEAVKMHGVEQPADWHPEGDVWVHTMLLLEKLRPGATSTLAWGALLHDIGKPATFRRDAAGPDGEPGRIRFNGHVEVGVRMAEEILGRLRFSNDDTEQIVALVKNHMRFGDVPQMRESTVRRFLRLPRFDEHLHLHWLDCTSCHGKLGIYETMRHRYEADDAPGERPALLVTGTDLIRAGYKPGPHFKQMLDAAEDAQLEGRITDRVQGLELVEREFSAAETPTPEAAPQSPAIIGKL